MLNYNEMFLGPGDKRKRIKPITTEHGRVIDMAPKPKANLMSEGELRKPLGDNEVGDNEGGSGSNMGKYAQIAGALGNAVPQSGYASKYDGTDFKETYESLEKTKDTIAAALGPYGMAFRGAEKAAKAIAGDGTAGDIVGSTVDPFSTQLELLKNKNATTGEKLSSLVPGLGGIAATEARNRSRGIAFDKQQRKRNRGYSDELEDKFEKRKFDENLNSEKKLRKMQLGFLNY